jgi:murein DD-endopeptidase MepM/ murein hydrolase activator NlpD
VARGRGGFTENNGYYDDESGEYQASQHLGRRSRRTIPLEPGYDEYGDYTGGRALVSFDETGDRLPALVQDETGPVIIAGDGVSMGEPFIKRRERPLSMRLTILGLITCIIVTGMFAVTPLGANAGSSISSFQAISGSIVLSKTPAFYWYTATWGDTPETISKKFKVQVGGFYELNKLMAGQEISVGIAYKIPSDPAYGADYIAPQFVTVSGDTGGTTVFGNSPWTSYAGQPGPDSEIVCAPNGDATGQIVPTAYNLQSPNWSSYWVRGFSWYHNGIDIATNAGNPIHAAQSGQVIWAGWDVGGLGYSVKINHCNHISTVYGHMEKLLVKAGDIVLAGDEVGLEGSTGDSTGPHLHYMVEVDNNPVDPFPYYNYSIPLLTKRG